MQVVLFEDERTPDLWPANLMRPTMELRTGAASALEVARRLGAPVGWVVRDYLAEVVERDLGSGRVADGARLFINARLVPRLAYVERLRALGGRTEAVLWTSADDVCAAFVPADAPMPPDLTPDNIARCLREGVPACEQVDLELMRYPHDLVRSHCAILPGNLEALLGEGRHREVAEGVYTGGQVSVHPSAVLDGRDGPIVLEDGVKIGPFAYVSGPAYLGRGSRLTDHSALKDGVALSEVCKVGGEVESSTFMPYSNKQHHGFIGHSFIGSWVNMGAGTSNSDLKNTYGEVRVEYRRGKVETGMQFLGCVIGDYSKTAINTSIFTGKIIGVASMIYGFVTRNVPSFCNWARSFGEVTQCSPDVVAATQKRMFARRDIAQTEADVHLLHEVFKLTREGRLMASEPPQL